MLNPKPPVSGVDYGAFSAIECRFKGVPDGGGQLRRSERSGRRRPIVRVSGVPVGPTRILIANQLLAGWTATLDTSSAMLRIYLDSTPIEPIRGGPPGRES
jgi:hypothetical protein